MLKNIGKPLETKRDDMYQWTDVVFSRQSVLDAVVFSAQKDMQPADSGLERSTENILRHLEPSIRDHPETTFKIYMPPYSVGYWYMTAPAPASASFCCNIQTSKSTTSLPASNGLRIWIHTLTIPITALP